MSVHVLRFKLRKANWIGIILFLPLVDLISENVLKDVFRMLARFNRIEKKCFRIAYCKDPSDDTDTFN